MLAFVLAGFGWYISRRERVIADDVRLDLHAYFGGILSHLGCVPVEINTEPDHAHLLFVMTT